MKKLFVLVLALASVSSLAADFKFECQLSVLKLDGAIYGTIEKVDFKPQVEKEIKFKKVPTKAVVRFEGNLKDDYTFGSMQIYNKNTSIKTQDSIGSYNVLIRKHETMFSLYGEGADKIRYLLDCVPKKIMDQYRDLLGDRQ